MIDKHRARSHIVMLTAVRLPQSVHRLPPDTSHDKQSTHARFTVTRLTMNGHHLHEPSKAKRVASSQQPVAGCDLACDSQSRAAL